MRPMPSASATSSGAAAALCQKSDRMVAMIQTCPVFASEAIRRMSELRSSVRIVVSVKISSS